MTKLLVEDVSVTFRRRRREPVHAVRSVTFEVAEGETLGIVGESGCGKTTLSRAILGLVKCEGSVFYEEKRLDWSTEAKSLRQHLQLIFQDPFASLNPRLTIRRALGEPLEVHSDLGKDEIRSQVDAMLKQVGLDVSDGEKYPHQFSGGQRQRIAIARALILQPDLVIADEPVSALDVSVQAQILNLLADVKREMGLTMLFISHDLSVIRHVADRVIVMKSGEIVEQGLTSDVMADPQHPYTKKLLAAAPTLEL